MSILLIKVRVFKNQSCEFREGRAALNFQGIFVLGKITKLNRSVRAGRFCQIFFLVLFSLFTATMSKAEVPKSSRCVSVAKISHGTLQNCMGQNVVILEGNSHEMAFAHGLIFKKFLSPDVSRYFSDKVDESVAFLPEFFKSLAQYLLSMISSKLHRNVPTHYVTDLEVYSIGSQVSFKQLSKALAAPDLGSLSYSYLNSSFKIPLFGCTSVGQIQEGDLVFGRNLDFEGSDLIDKHSLLVVHKPTIEGELKRAAFVADGIHFSGISGFNEAGMAVFVHQNFSSDRSIRGAPIMLLIDWLLKSSHNLDEAVHFLQQHRPGPMWTMVLVDTKQKKIKAIESSYGVFGIREPQSFTRGNVERTEFVQTNHLLTPEAQSVQWISYPLLRNSQVRYQKAAQILSEAKGRPSLDSIRQILSYQKTLKNFEPSLYDDIAKPSTVHTILLEAKKGQEPEIYLSRFLAPSSQGSFIKIKMKDFFAAGEQTLKYERVDQNPQHKPLYQKQRVLVQAFKASEDHYDYRKALELIHDFHSPAILLYKASLFYQLEQWGEVRRVLKEFSQYRTGVPMSLHESAAALMVFSLYREGRKEEAQNLAADYLKKPQWVHKHWFNLLYRIVSGDDPKPSELEVWFDSFSGDINTPPTHLTSVSNVPDFLE